MIEHSCGCIVSPERRTCPCCGRIVNPSAPPDLTSRPLVKPSIKHAPVKSVTRRRSSPPVPLKWDEWPQPPSMGTPIQQSLDLPIAATTCDSKRMKRRPNPARRPAATAEAATRQASFLPLLFEASADAPAPAKLDRVHVNPVIKPMPAHVKKR